MKLYFNITLFYDDGPILWECFDKFQQPYIAIDVSKDRSESFFIRVELLDLLSFKKGEIDLLSLIEKSYDVAQKWFYLKSGVGYELENDIQIFRPQAKMTPIPQNLLPEEGFYLKWKTKL
jgi:hypothetical protein